MAAESLAVASAVIGIAAFAFQIASKIEDLKDLRAFTPAEVAGQLESLSDRLELFRMHLVALEPLESLPTVKFAVQQSSKRFRVVENALQKLQRKRNRLKLMIDRQYIEEKIKKAEDSINGMILDIQLACLVGWLSREQLQTSGATIVTHRTDSSLGEPGDAATIQESAITIEQAVIETIPAREEQSQVILKGTNRHHCGQRHCDCLCHLTERKSGRFWFLEYTPLSVLLKKPENGRCGSSQFCLNFRLALSNYGIPLAIVAGLNITADAIGFTLRPALRTERIVKYTSPGFETLTRLENCNISFGEAQTKFVELYRSDPSFRYHRDPSGQSYLQKLLKYPWGFGSEKQFALLQMFVDEFGMTLADQDSGFLTTCAEWIGEGPHLNLLNTILKCGFDPTTVNSPLWEQWPASCSPDWISEQQTSDPFFVEYLATLVKDHPNFSGSTPLCNAVLVGSDKDIEAWVSKSQPLEENRTFLGQSPLHLAITNPAICKLLLDAGHGLDVTDKWGTTPLMYAAGMGERQTVALLLSKGADPIISQNPRPYEHDGNSRTFVHYAIARGHLDLVLDALGMIRTLYGIEALHVMSQLAIMITISTNLYFIDSRAAFFSELVKNLANINMPFQGTHKGVDDNNLMHYVLSVEEASALVRCGFNQFNDPNSDGKLAINSLARHANPALIKFCIENGTDVRNKDKKGRTILFDLFSNLSRAGDWKAWEKLDAIRLCLDAGVDVFETDNCRCPCSPGGCTISSVFLVDFFSSTELVPAPGLHVLWSLEWVTLVEEHCGVEVARQVLLLLIRRARCNQADDAITHVCCHRGRGMAGHRWCEYRLRPLADEDITEILDEEGEIDQLASDSLDFLWLRWMSDIKTKYDAHVEAVEKERAEDEPQFSKGLPRDFHVDYKNDTYEVNFYVDYTPTANSMTHSLASYAFWLQYEYARTDNSSLREVRRDGWFERRVSWLGQLIVMMKLSADEITAEMRRLHKQESACGAVRKEVNMDLDFLVRARLEQTGIIVEEST